jgi:hypothetical protein
MNWLQKLPGFQRSAHGLEWALWRKLPLIMVVGTALPLMGAGAVRLWATEPLSPATERLVTLADYFAVSLVVLHWTLVLTVAIGCVIVMLMKGPAYVADGYAVSDSDQPRPPDPAP